MPPSSQYTPTKVISILPILARFCEQENRLAQQGSPLVPMAQLFLERWHDPAPDCHIGGNPGTLGSEKS